MSIRNQQVAGSIPAGGSRNPSAVKQLQHSTDFQELQFLPSVPIFVPIPLLRPRATPRAIGVCDAERAPNPSALFSGIAIIVTSSRCPMRQISTVDGIFDVFDLKLQRPRWRIPASHIGALQADTVPVNRLNRWPQILFCPPVRRDGQRGWRDGARFERHECHFVVAAAVLAFDGSRGASRGASSRAHCPHSGCRKFPSTSQYRCRPSSRR